MIAIRESHRWPIIFGMASVFLMASVALARVDATILAGGSYTTEPLRCQYPNGNPSHCAFEVFWKESGAQTWNESPEITPTGDGYLSYTITPFATVGTYTVKAQCKPYGANNPFYVCGTVTVVDVLRVMFLWGYQGDDAGFNTERPKIQPIIDKLVGLGYTVYEDGATYNQSNLDVAFTQNEIAAHPKQIIIHWNTTLADWTKYMTAGVVGVLWASHGYMEPYPGCPDNQLLDFESRVWTAAAAHPETTGSKVFVRDWKDKIPDGRHLLFLVMHACGTGGIGGYQYYRDHPWEYTDAATVARVSALYNPVPGYDGLNKFTVFNVFSGNCGYLKTYDGASYFGFGDVDIDGVKNSIK